jgi:hypothetical protein
VSKTIQFEEHEAKELRDRLRNLGVRPPHSQLPVLTALAGLSLPASALREQIRSATQRYRSDSASTFWPCHRLPELYKAIHRPEAAEAGVIIEFFGNVAGLELLDAKRHNPRWFKPPKLVAVATIAALRHRSRLLKSLSGFRNGEALSDAELWFGLGILAVSMFLRDEILQYFNSVSIANICQHCHRLTLRRHAPGRKPKKEIKYCSNQCMQAANDAAKRRRRTERTA